MSQGRLRKKSVVPSKNNDTKTQIAPSTAKIADDSLTQNYRQHHDNQRSRSKNRIPKSMRLDLDNALVSLCDVWFQEIKPHLVRNNIKLHVDGTGAGCASGDHEQSPPTAPSCSHLDPGAARDLPQRTAANYVSSCLTPPTVLKAQCRKRPKLCRRQAQPAQPLQPPLLSRRHSCIQNPEPSCKENRLQRPYTAHNRKKRRSPQMHVNSNWRVPRLCRTYSFIPSDVPQLPQSSPRHDNYHQAPSKRPRKTEMINKLTQTELTIPTGHVINVATQTHLVGARAYSPDSHSLRRGNKITLLSTPTTYHRPRYSTNEPVLFQDDLIEIIGEKHDKRLKFIYNSSEQVDYLSVMNLVSPNVRSKKCLTLNRSPPWR